MSKKKKGHGGLKFLVFLAIVATLIVTIKIGVGTEAGQRIVGNREERRIEHTSLTPRFAFAAATAQVTVAAIYTNDDGTTVDLTSTKQISIDRQSGTASKATEVSLTPSQISPGVDAIPMDDITDSYTQILTKDYRYETAIDAGQPWDRYKAEPSSYGTEIDPHYIPMIDDIMGFELRDLPTKPLTVEPKAGLKSSVRRVNGPSDSSSVTLTYSYEMNMATFRRAIPILANRTDIVIAPDTPVTVIIGFDDAGLLRFADVEISSATATTAAQVLGPRRRVVYHYTLDVTEISGEPIAIDVPTDFVDAPDETAPVNSAPADTVPVATP
ncbi:MAG: hypothetical protein JJD93_17590 [Ilumatobacteraceae bacterium]|nr:hypothetical protein [Ilumatobacteraceae bacterium]